MATIKISGMRCGHCVASVTNALSEIEGISEVQIDLEKGEASYEENSPLAPEIIKNAISRIGFEVIG